ncbi:MAG TPA: hypothetical protein VHZ26_16630 [Caulobacteraceae bacterium]|jgi:hypothetical protein|nr:hypothetical protein [Caulobacteraceae bacterium]
MRLGSRFANAALLAAAGALVLATALAFPAASLAQPYNETAAEQCEQQQNSRAVAGAVLGGVTGAGVAEGADAGASTADCQPDYHPLPPPGYDGGPNAYDNAPPPQAYPGGPPPGYRPASGRNCGPAQRLITFPDGTEIRDTIEACQDDNGHWMPPPGSN